MQIKNEMVLCIDPEPFCDLSFYDLWNIINYYHSSYRSSIAYIYTKNTLKSLLLEEKSSIQLELAIPENRVIHDVRIRITRIDENKFLIQVDDHKAHSIDYQVTHNSFTMVITPESAKNLNRGTILITNNENERIEGRYECHKDSCKIVLYIDNDEMLPKIHALINMFSEIPMIIDLRIMRIDLNPLRREKVEVYAKCKDISIPIYVKF